MNAGGVRTGWRTAYVRIFATARVLPRTTVKALYSAYATGNPLPPPLDTHTNSYILSLLSCSQKLQRTQFILMRR
jgi:hypothetical protein